MFFFKLLDYQISKPLKRQQIEHNIEVATLNDNIKLLETNHSNRMTDICTRINASKIMEQFGKKTMEYFKKDPYNRHQVMAQITADMVTIIEKANHILTPD